MTGERDYQQKSRAFYDQVYHQATFGTTRSTPHFKKVAQWLNIAPGEAVVDIACGTGVWLAAARERSGQVAGIDLSEVAIEKCRKNFPEGTFHVGNAEQLPFADQMFDVVTCLGALEHFLDKEAALQEMVRVAKPNARFLILIPNADFYLTRLGLYGGTYQKDAVHEEVLPLPQWQALLKCAGLHITECRRDTHTLAKYWITRGSPLLWPVRLAVALAMPLIPISWQYQVYLLCQKEG